MLHLDDVRLCVAVGVHDAVPAGLRDAGDSGSVADLVAEGVGKRLQVVLHPVAAAGVGAAVGPAPPGGGEELFGGGVHDLAPGGEQADVCPLADGAAGGGACFQHERAQTPFQQMSCGSQPNGSGADDDYGRGEDGGRSHDDSSASMFVDAASMHPESTSVNIEVHLFCARSGAEGFRLLLGK